MINNNTTEQKDSLLPPPEILIKYQELGIGEDIIKLVKKEQEHRHKLQNKYQVNYRMGQLFGFLIFIAMIFNSGYLIKSGYVIDAYISLAIFSIFMIIISYNIKSGNISKRRTIINKRVRKRNYKYLKMKKKLFLLGLLSSLAFAPLYFFPILFFSLKYLLETIIDCKDNKKVFYYAWLFGFGYFIGNCYWYCHSMLMWPYYPFIPFAITIIPAFLALYTASTAFLTKKVSDNLKINDFFVVLFFSLFWTFLEYLRGVLFTGFPWNLIAYSFGFSNILIQTVHIFGSYIFGFFCMNLYTFFYIKKHNKYTLFYYITLSIFILFYGIFTKKYISN